MLNVTATQLKNLVETWFINKTPSDEVTRYTIGDCVRERTYNGVKFETPYNLVLVLANYRDVFGFIGLESKHDPLSTKVGLVEFDIDGTYDITVYQGIIDLVNKQLK